MKKLLTILVSFSFVLTSCDYLQGYIKGTSASAEDSLAAKEDYIAERDRSITAANAYSDLFLDSTAVESFIQANAIADTTARRMRSFYNSRNYQAAWMTSNGFTEQGRGFWNRIDSAQTNGDSAALQQNTNVLIDSLMEEDTLHLNAADSLFVKTELTLTQQFVQQAKMGLQSERNLHAFLLPARKVDALQLADSIINKETDSTLWQNNQAYTALKEELKRWHTLAKDSSWQPIAGKVGQLRKGASAPLISSIKKRLAATGDWQSKDTSQLFSDSLQRAVVLFQKRHGLDSSGMITDTMITLLNVHPQDRVEQLLVNLNRMMWMPQMEEGSRAVVNIPQFMLQVYDGDSVAFEMPVVVGKEGSNTLLLNGTISEVVFNPYWNIPASIVQSEIMPAMQKDKAYLKKNNMEIVNGNDSIPQVRQLPGANNALGKVKFLFPNSYDIYLHDTPAKGLFEQDKRAFSHGCIRVADAQKLAQHLLRNQNGWGAEKVTEAMNSGKEQKVQVQNPLPIYITYYTVWVDESGKVHYRDDVYGQDARTRSLLFTDSAA